AGKIASAVDGHGRIPVREDLDLALEYDEERTIHFALLPQNFAGVERSLACERGEPLDLRPRQDRKNVFLGCVRSRAFDSHGSDPTSKDSRDATPVEAVLFVVSRFTDRARPLLPRLPTPRRDCRAGAGEVQRSPCPRTIARPSP